MPSLGGASAASEQWIRRVAGQRTKDGLYKHVEDFTDFSSVLIALAERAPDRLTISQAVFFIAAAAADLRGTPKTFTEIREAVGPAIGKSLHTTYKDLLDGPNRRDSKQQGLNWLVGETDPSDKRNKYLRLTTAGRKVLSDMLG